MNTFITNSNSKSIIYKLDLNNIDLEGEIYHIDFKWFSKYEVKGLLAFKMLFKNPDEFFKKYKPRRAIDSKQYVFEGQAPAHHKDPHCDRMLSSFHNYKLPKELKEKGEDAINKFRIWFKENSYLMEDKMDLFLDRLQWKFGLKERPEVVDYKNSGVEIIENLNLEELESKIEKKIVETNIFYMSSNKNRIILDKFGQISFIYKNKKEPNNNKTIYSNEEIWDLLKEFEEEYKTPIIFLLREYYRVKYNPELEFEGSLLERLGFEPCRVCYDIEYLNYFSNKLESNKSESLEFKQKSHNVFKIIKNKTEILLFENEDFKVTTDYDRFKNHMENWLNEHPHLSEDKALLSLISQINNTSALIDAITLCNENRLFSRLEYRLAGLLEEGSCIVFNKKKNTLVKRIEENEYGFQIGPSCGKGGRIFLADGEEFFKVEDWIS